MAIDKRIAELKALAKEEGITVSPESEKDLRAYVGALDRPLIEITDSGRFRAIYHGYPGQKHLAVTFLGNGRTRRVSIP